MASVYLPPPPPEPEPTPINPASFAQGTITVGTMAVQGPAVNVPANHAVALIADSANTGTVFIGIDSTVTTGTGFPLSPGTVVLLKISDLNAIWFIADADGQVVRYITEV